MVLLVVLLAGAALFWSAWQGLRVGYWNDTDRHTYTHGYLILAVTLWLLWRSRRDLDGAAPRVWWPGIVATLFLNGLYYLAWISGTQVGYFILLPAILLCAATGTLGFRVVRVLAFPLGYLYFAVPVWDSINDQLQSLSVFGVSLLLRATSVPAYIEGNHVAIPSGTFEIAGGCSGLHFLIVALAVGALYGELGRDRLSVRVKLLVLAAVLAVLLNWVRIYTIILQGHLTNMQGYLVRVDHYKFGWVLFAVLLVIYFWLARKIAPDEPMSRPSVSKGERPAGPGSGYLAVACSLLAMAAGPALAKAAEHIAKPGPAALSLPQGAAGWSGPNPADMTWVPRYFQPDAEAMGAYAKGEAKLATYLNAYVYQAQGHELVYYQNDVLGGAGWQRLGARSVSVDTTEGKRFPYTEIEAFDADGNHWLVARTQVVGGRVFDREIASKLYYGIAVLRRQPVSGLIAVAAQCSNGCGQAHADIQSFLSGQADALVARIGTAEPVSNTQ